MAKKIQSAGGIGESKMFCAPLPEGEMTGVDRIQKCHINGVLIGELKLDPQVLGALDYWQTDEGVKERNDRPGPKASADITVGAEGFDKALMQRRDDVRDRDMDLYEARDPFKEVADRYTSQGFRPKMLSAAKIKQGGGDHEIVKYPAGHPQAGDPVMAKGMVLGQMPTARAEARNKHYRRHAQDMLAQVEAKHKAQQGIVGKNQD